MQSAQQQARLCRVVGVWVLLGGAWACTALVTDASAAEVAADGSSKENVVAKRLFVEEIQPLLKKRCLGCHGDGEMLEANLDLRTREGMLKGGDRGAALVPGQPSESPLYQAVLRSGDLIMPPKRRNRLTPQEVAALRQWIEAGAPWATASDLAKTESRWEYRDADLWAYRPIRQVSVPDASGSPAWGKTAIDAFILRKLQQAGLSPAPPADRLTLIRRATFDLTGLPPTPEDIAAFLNDPSPNAFSEVIDRLLASPHYGEQWGRHWLDVVRYADTAGFSNDYERPHAWRYRDYVIRSFNQDKPYDQFVLEQIAGDEIAPEDPEALIATGFLRMGPWEHTSMSVAAVTRQMYLDDVTNIVGVTFLAQGLQCAKCHDHKFDPIPTRDYYRMQAIFAPVQFAERKLPFQEFEHVSEGEDQRRRIEERLAQARTELKALQKKHRQAVAKLLEEKGVETVDELPEEERPRRQYGLTFDELGVRKVLRKRIAYFQLALQRFEPKCFSIASGGLKKKVPTPDVRILIGGALDSPGEKVAPGVLSIVHSQGDWQQYASLSSTSTLIPETTEGRRAALARWIASPENPLTARVMVNRVWQHHFGTGICANSNNFGKMGKEPTHPELLDWLATRFIKNGWSLKQMHRLIMNSAVYQCSSRHPQSERVRQMDPNNELLAWFPPRRLSAEEIRDSMLAASGELNTTLGGFGVFPEINQEVALQPRHIMGSVAPAYLPSPTPQQRNRRTIYAFKIRTLRDPMLQVFNQPGTDVACERRDETTVTPQAFTLFNSQRTHNRALAMARRLEWEAKSADERITLGFRLVYGRLPTDAEMDLCLKHLRQTTEHHRQTSPVVVERPQSIVRSMQEEMTGEAFAWVEDISIPGYRPDLKPWQVGPETRALAELCLVLLNSNEFLNVY